MKQHRRAAYFDAFKKILVQEIAKLNPETMKMIEWHMLSNDISLYSDSNDTSLDMTTIYEQLRLLLGPDAASVILENVYDDLLNKLVLNMPPEADLSKLSALKKVLSYAENN